MKQSRQFWINSDPEVGLLLRIYYGASSPNFHHKLATLPWATPRGDHRILIFGVSSIVITGFNMSRWVINQGSVLEAALTALVEVCIIASSPCISVTEKDLWAT